MKPSDSLELPRSNQRPAGVTVDVIRRVVETGYDLPPGATRRRTNAPRISHARHVAMFLIRQLLGYSLPHIGRSYGGYHHSTVLYAIQHVKKAIAKDEQASSAIRELRRKIESTPPAPRAEVNDKLKLPEQRLFT